MEELRKEAKAEARDKEDYTWQNVHCAAKTFRYEAATGADQARPRHLVHGGMKELGAVAKLLSRSVKQCQWPSQMLANLVALQPKDLE
eukprot:12163245-Karenia_brevis.AAC.1